MCLKQSRNSGTGIERRYRRDESIQVGSHPNLPRHCTVLVYEALNCKEMRCPNKQGLLKMMVAALRWSFQMLASNC